MAILRNGINGGFSGKLGNVVGVMQGDVCIIKSLPKHSKKNKIGSKEQNRYRTRFRNLHQFLKPLLPWIRVGFNMEGRSLGHTAYNLAKSHNLLHAVDENGILDYSQILLTKGKNPHAEQLQVQKDDAGFHFTWTNQAHLDTSRFADQFMMMAYDVEHRSAYYSLSSNRRSKLQDSLDIPLIEQGNSFHIWCAFIADDRQSITNSLYLGAMEF